MVDRHDLAGDVHPARIGIFFVLLLDAQGDFVVDFGQARNRAAQLTLLVRLAQLLRQ